MTSAFTWQNSISLCPASFRIPRPKLPVIPGNQAVIRSGDDSIRPRVNYAILQIVFSVIFQEKQA